MITLIRIIALFGEVLSTALLIRAIMSWVVGFFRNDLVRKVYGVLETVTEPIVMPCRNLMNRYFNTGMFDFSIFVAMILVSLVTRILIRVLLMFV